MKITLNCGAGTHTARSMTPETTESWSPAGLHPARDMRSGLQGRPHKQVGCAVGEAAPPRETESRNACVPASNIDVGPRKFGKVNISE